jgi:geranylgeranyl transferase type-1 subunit beta
MDHDGDEDHDAPAPLELARTRHALHVQRCLTALPASHVDLDSSRSAACVRFSHIVKLLRSAALAFYCIGALDLLGALERVSAETRDGWRTALWALQSRACPGARACVEIRMLP